MSRRLTTVSGVEGVSPVRGANFIANLLQDIQYAARYSAQPGILATAFVALAWGSGPTQPYLRSSTPYCSSPLVPEPDRNRAAHASLSGREWSLDLDSQIHRLAPTDTSVPGRAAYDFAGPGINPPGVTAPSKSRNPRLRRLLRVFGTPLAMGRTFTDEEDRPAARSYRD